jgi:hypothetical protein
VVGLADIGQRDVGAFARQTLNDGSADTPAAAGDQGPFVLKGHLGRSSYRSSENKLEIQD